MAAAEYYSNMPMSGQQQYNSYQQPTHQSYPTQAPPPYQAASQTGSKPSVHFAHQSQPQSQRLARNSFSSQAPIPVVGDYHHVTPPQNSSPRPSHSQPHAPHHSEPGPGPYLHPDSANVRPYNPAQSRPHLNPSSSQYSLPGYSSDPEHHRRRRRRHSQETRQDKGEDREVRSHRSSKHRSRSTNADGFLGAAGGGLIGDLIFPGLGTVGGAVAGWIGGKDYGKHRKHKEETLQREQEDWERKFGKGNHNHSRRHSHSREGRSHNKHKHDY